MRRRPPAGRGNRVGVGGGRVALARRLAGPALPRPGTLRGGHRRTAGPPTPRVAFLRRLSGAEQVGRRVGPQPGSEDLLRLRSKEDPSLAPVMLRLVSVQG